jgi:hypothetical protein
LETQLRFEGRSIEEAMGKARNVCGPDAKILFARRISTKGILGLGAKYRFEVVAEPPHTPVPAAEHHQFAAELRDALRFDATRTGVTPPVSKKKSPFERYAEAASLADEPIEHEMADRSAGMITTTGEEAPPRVRVFKRDGSKAISGSVTPPPWHGSSSVTAGSSDQDEEVVEGELEIMESETYGSGVDRFRTVRSSGWSGLVDLASAPAIIDLTANDPVLRFEPTESPRELYPAVSPTKYALSLELLHEIPTAAPGTVIIFAGRESYDQGQTFLSLASSYGVRESDQFVFGSSTDVVIWGHREADDPRELLASLDLGRTVALWVDDVAVKDVMEALSDYPILVFGQVDVAAPISESERYLSELPAIDGLCLSGMARADDPLAVLGLGVPVATIDGRVSTVGAWVRLLAMKGVA